MAIKITLGPRGSLLLLALSGVALLCVYSILFYMWIVSFVFWRLVWETLDAA